jgi:hypothetical protein
LNTTAHDAPAANDHGGYIPLPRPLKQKIKDGIVALTMATLCFLRPMSHLLYDGNRYFDNLPVLPVELLALAVNILGVALLIFAGISIWRRFQKGMVPLVLDLLFLFLLVFPADCIRSQTMILTDTQLVGLLKQPMARLCIVAALILLIWKHRLAARIVAAVIVVTFPMALLTLAKILLVCCNLMNVNECTDSVPPPPPLLPVREGQPRVVWIIFDETDYRAVYEKRPAKLALPEFDRFRQVALSADHAYAPADMTIISMPALISGRRLLSVSRDGCDLALNLADTNTTNDWTALPSVFSQARELGVNTALVGWHIPYARLLGGSLNYCSWYASAFCEPADSTTFGGSIQQQILSLAWPFRSRQIFINMCQDSLKDSLPLVADPKYGLVLLHLPPPHNPGIYLPEKNQFTCLGMPRPASYFNNLVLTDHELGDLRRSMETSGQWDKSWIILSADHSWRASQTYDGVRDYRVPFLVKSPGVGQSLTYTTPFNTVLTRDFILAILQGNITSQQEVAAWLDAHGKPDLPVTLRHADFY